MRVLWFRRLAADRMAAVAGSAGKSWMALVGLVLLGAGCSSKGAQTRPADAAVDAVDVGADAPPDAAAPDVGGADAGTDLGPPPACTPTLSGLYQIAQARRSCIPGAPRLLIKASGR